MKVKGSSLDFSLFKKVKFVWLFLSGGFVLGSLTLLGPVEWIAQLIHQRGWPHWWEDWIVRFVVLLLILLTAWLAWKGVKLTTRARTFLGKVGIPFVSTLAAIIFLWLWMTPSYLSSLLDGNEISPSPHFTFGPYPTPDRIAALKKEGYSAIISLLHPAIIPFEPKLLLEEQEVASRIGIELLHIPMVPWLSKNEESLKKIKELAQLKKGRYYVHCYLGRDRVLVAKRIVEKFGASATTEAAIQSPLDLSQLKALERGSIIPLDRGVTIIPYPSEEEWIGYILNGTIQSVVSLLDPNNPEDQPWIEKERKYLAEYAMPLFHFPIPEQGFSKVEIRAVVEKVRALPHPLVVHSFRTDTPIIQAFIKVYNGTED